MNTPPKRDDQARDFFLKLLGERAPIKPTTDSEKREFFKQILQDPRNKIHSCRKRLIDVLNKIDGIDESITVALRTAETVKTTPYKAKKGPKIVKPVQRE